MCYLRRRLFLSSHRCTFRPPSSVPSSLVRAFFMSPSVANSATLAHTHTHKTVYISNVTDDMSSLQCSCLPRPPTLRMACNVNNTLVGCCNIWYGIHGQLFITSTTLVQYKRKEAEKFR